MEFHRRDFLEYWGLSHDPFGRDSGDRFYAGRPQRDAIARLTTLVGGELSCGVLLSPGGCGMTTLMRHVAASAGFADCAVEMLMTDGHETGGIAGVFGMLGRAMRLPPQWTGDATAVISAMEMTSRQGVRTVWMVDGADAASCAVARRLLDGNRMISVVLGTTPDAAHRLSVSLGHCPLRIDLNPLSVEHTGHYLGHALYMAGTTETIFSDTAVVRLNEIGEGRIGMITAIAQYALIEGARAKQSRITADVIESSQDQLVRAA